MTSLPFSPNRFVHVLGAALALAACHKAPPANESPAEAAAPALRDGGTDATSPEKKPTSPASENLLHTVPAKVAVSSKVANPKDFPEFLVDGKLGTAWNGKTGDLVGGAIAFRVPKDAHVAAIRLTVGYDATSKAGEDLFTANHRIAEVAVERDGVKLRSFTLDPDKRGLQSLRIDGPGGDYRIVVEKTIPGAKKAWKELVVSELEVLGTPGREVLAQAGPPAVVVGTLDTPPAPRLGADAGKAVDGPYPSVAAFCAAHTALVTPTFAAEKDEYPGFIEPPYCVPGKPLELALEPPFVEARTVRVHTHDAIETRVALTTARGVFVTPAVIGIEELRNPGCGGIVEAALEGKELVRTALGPAVEIVSARISTFFPFPQVLSDGSLGDSGTGSVRRERVSTLCRASASGQITCVTTPTGHGEVDFTRRDAVPVAPYSELRARKVHPSGEVSYE